MSDINWFISSINVINKFINRLYNCSQGYIIKIISIALSIGFLNEFIS